MTSYVERLLQAARSMQEPPDLAALLALKAYRWAPYDTDDAAQPAVYNTLWLALSRIDAAAARALLAPGDPAAGKLATTHSRVLVEAVQARTPPIDRGGMASLPAPGACYTPVAARVCER
jgi:hypothetical protein